MSEFISLGLGRFVRADRILALEPIEGDERGPGRRTRVWLEGLEQPVVASRSESAILAELDGAEPSRADERTREGRRRGEEPPSLF